MKLKNAPIAALVAAEVVSILGSRMTYLALPWFVLVTTGSAAKMSIVLAAELVPMALFGIPSGMVVERLGARTTMLVCDAARAPLLLAVPILHAAGMLHFSVLLALVFLLGCFMAPYFAAQRVILPELVGEDETTIAQANSVIEGGTAFAGLAGPALAGILIPFLGAPNVLYVDAATYAVSFLLLAGFVPRRKPVPAGETRHGALAGIRFLLRDRLLGPLSSTVIVLNFLGAALSATLPYYAYHEFAGNSKVAGLFFTAMGAGALLGSIGAVLVVKRLAPLKLSGLAIVAMTLPLWLLPLGLPATGVMAVLFAAMLFAPLVNGPVIGVITARTPVDLRPKMMTALITVSTLTAPLGFLAAGQLLEPLGVLRVFGVVAVGMTGTALVFAAIAFRRGGELLPEAEPAAA
ncbi:MAG TPA: MFS transporter [Gaiellaceae bacterium]|nr:MFS transporter [Gaiellaceae bacterium]